MRLIVARCEARYTGRLDTYLPEALRLVMKGGRIYKNELQIQGERT